MHEAELHARRNLAREDVLKHVAPLMRQRFESRVAAGSFETYLMPSIEKAWGIVAMPVR